VGQTNVAGESIMVNIHSKLGMHRRRSLDARIRASVWLYAAWLRCIIVSLRKPPTGVTPWSFNVAMLLCTADTNLSKIYAWVSARIWQIQAS